MCAVFAAIFMQLVPGRKQKTALNFYTFSVSFVYILFVAPGRDFGCLISRNRILPYTQPWGVSEISPLFIQLCMEFTNLCSVLNFLQNLKLKTKKYVLRLYTFIRHHQTFYQFKIVNVPKLSLQRYLLKRS